MFEDGMYSDAEDEVEVEVEADAGEMATKEESLPDSGQAAPLEVAASFFCLFLGPRCSFFPDLLLLSIYTLLHSLLAVVGLCCVGEFFRFKGRDGVQDGRRRSWVSNLQIEIYKNNTPEYCGKNNIHFF